MDLLNTLTMISPLIGIHLHELELVQLSSISHSYHSFIDTHELKRADQYRMKQQVIENEKEKADIRRELLARREVRSHLKTIEAFGLNSSLTVEFINLFNQDLFNQENSTPFTELCERVKQLSSAGAQLFPPQIEEEHQENGNNNNDEGYRHEVERERWGQEWCEIIDSLQGPLYGIKSSSSELSKKQSQIEDDFSALRQCLLSHPALLQSANRFSHADDSMALLDRLILFLLTTQWKAPGSLHYVLDDGRAFIARIDAIQTMREVEKMIRWCLHLSAVSDQLLDEGLLAKRPIGAGSYNLHIPSLLYSTYFMYLDGPQPGDWKNLTTANREFEKAWKKKATSEGSQHWIELRQMRWNLRKLCLGIRTPSSHHDATNAILACQNLTAREEGSDFSWIRYLITELPNPTRSPHLLSMIFRSSTEYQLRFRTFMRVLLRKDNNPDLLELKNSERRRLFRTWLNPFFASRRTRKLLIELLQNGAFMQLIAAAQAIRSQDQEDLTSSTATTTTAPPSWNALLSDPTSLSHHFICSVYFDLLRRNERSILHIWHQQLFESSAALINSFHHPDTQQSPLEFIESLSGGAIRVRDRMRQELVGGMSSNLFVSEQLH